MMITIHGFPAKTKYQDVKLLIKRECNINDFILDNLVNDSDGSKKVRVGLTDDTEGYKLMKCLDGYRMPGNCVLKLVPVGKAAQNLAPQTGFDSGPGYQIPQRNDSYNPPRNDYMNQPSNDYINQGSGGSQSYGRLQGASGPHGPGGSHGHSGPHHQSSLDTMGRPSPWASGSNNSNHWNPNAPMAAQVPQNSFTFNSQQSNMNTFGQQHQQNLGHPRLEMRPFNQGREQNFGFPPKTEAPTARQVESRRALRSIETVETPASHPTHGRYPASQPYQQDKPAQPTKPQFSKPSPTSYEKTFDDRKYVQPDIRDTKTQAVRPDTQDRTYKDYEKRRGFSPRRSPHGRRVTPERRVSPSGRRVSPSGRRVSPHGRKFSPPVKRISPDRRMMSHHTAARRESPHKRPSPIRRLVSPPRRPSPSRRASPGRRDSPPRQSRYSPDRHHIDKLDKYAQDKLKQIRPAYEPSAHASNQGMYSGGYRPSAQENVQYPMPGIRQVELRNSPWQRERDEVALPIKKLDEDRRDMSRMQMGRERIPETVVEVKRTLTPQRKSRSPMRRSRSPLRECYKRHSGSPRSSHSPRRSWALEKRRSPDERDAPPPPSWPGQRDKGKHVPVWDDRRPFNDDNIRPAKDLSERQPMPQSTHRERFPQREPKFVPREDYDAERRDNYRRRDNSPESKLLPHREDYDLSRRPRDHEQHPHQDYHRRREPSPRHVSRKEEPSHPNIDKDFEDIYNRALQFKKKAEELRKLGSKKREDYLEDERSAHHSERDREDNSRPQRYEDRHKFHEEEQLRLRERDGRPQDRPRHEPRPDDVQRRDYRPRDDFPQPDRERERPDDRPIRFTLSPTVRIKRDKAIEEIANKIIDRHEEYKQLKGEHKARVLEELKLAVARIVFEMFGDTDVSFIEIIIKYQARYSIKEEAKILQEVMASLPSQFRFIKRHGPELSEVPAKTARRSSSPKLMPEKKPAPSPMKQRPPKVCRRKNLAPKVDLPPKPEPKISPTEPKVVKEVKKQEEVEKPVAPAPVEPQHGGHYELNERMTRMVETELRDIMIKVWQELPDNPTDEAEYMVVDKLRNEAGDDLRNVLGLNVTKRLLNVYNPLYVKVQFSGKPEKLHLGEFLKKYNFTAFKRIEKTVNMFAAQVKTISDFDRICSAKDIKCGNITVTVNPIYKFTKCPQNLVTSFYDKDEDAGDETTTEISEKDIGTKDAVTDKVDVKIETNKSLDTISKPNVAVIKTENVAKVNINVNQTKVVSKTVENKIVPNNPAVANKPAVKNSGCESKIAVNKPAVENKMAINKPEIENKTAVNKVAAANKNDVNKPTVTNVNKPTVENKIVVNKSTIENKIAVNKGEFNKPTVQNKSNTNKPVVDTKININKSAIDNKINVSKPTVEKTAANNTAVSNKTAVNKPAVVNKAAVNKPPVENKVVRKPDQINAKNSDIVKKPTLLSVKTQIKVTDDNARSEVKQNKVEKKVNKVESDYDELDDHDILALMSEGIILDECSGSDDE